MSRFAQLKGFALPSSLDALEGPTWGGTIELHHSVIWAPDSQTITLSDFGQAFRAYVALINEGTQGEQERWMNRDVLIEIWPRLILPDVTYEAWMTRFPQLPTNQLLCRS